MVVGVNRAARVAFGRGAHVRFPRRFFSGHGIMQGMVVLEIANVLAGPSVGQFLGELGARVIKVESPLGGGDVTRTWKLPGEKAADGVTAYFSACNLGKESVVVDFKAEQGKALVHALAEKADCVIASFKPGDAEKLGVDSESLRARNDRLIYAQITGYGLDDPRVGYDAVVQAESGFQFMNGSPDGEPCKMPVALVDVITAHQLKQAVLIELWRRERTGKGAFVSVSLMHSAMTALVNQATGYLIQSAVPKRMGSDHPTIAPYGSIFTGTKPEEPLILAVGSNIQFKGLCDVLGVPELYAAGSPFEHNHGRCANRDQLKGLLQNEVAKWPRRELLEALSRKNVPAGAINDMRSAFEQSQGLDLVVFESDETLRNEGRRPGVLGPKGVAPIGLRQIAFKGSPEGLETSKHFSPPPRYGQHTEHVLHGFLGLSKERIALLRNAGVIM